MKKAYEAPVFLAEEVIPCKDIMCSTDPPKGGKCGIWLCWNYDNYPHGCRKCYYYKGLGRNSAGDDIDALSEDEYLDE